jgi:hypothetical protein
MSYTIAVVAPPIPADDGEAWKALHALIDQQGPVPSVFRTLHDRLTLRYPCLSSLPDDQIDDGVWSDGPLWNNFSHRAAVLGMVYSSVEEVLPFVIETATALDLAVFDWATNQVHRSDGLEGLNLTLEDQPVLRAPTIKQVHAAVHALTPRSGPGFLILEGRSQNYAQAAGGDGAYTAEWREYSGQQFRHWVAGVPGRPSKKEIAIPTNGFEVTVRENERLDAGDVKAILTAFADRKERPTHFAWRDITERFA